MTQLTAVDELLMTKLRERYTGLSEKEVRDDLKSKYTDTWNAAELEHEFEVHEHVGPIVQVTRKADGKIGTVGYVELPRMYFAFVEDKNE